MPYQIKKDGEQYCIHKENADGTIGEVVKGHCHPTRSEAENDMRALYANVEDAAAKYFELIAVKAVGDWEIDITALPYNINDSDGQYFDADTNIMQDSYPKPPLFYQHGVEPGAKGLQGNPVVIGKTISIEKKPDGLHIRAILDKTSEYAKRVWEAIKKGIVAVSSDSIAHLARLDVDGKVIQYEKNRPGRIAVWPLAGVSLWEKDGGNFAPASHNAIALPAMKAIYRDAGLPFPELDEQNGVSQTAEMVQKRAKVIAKSKEVIKKAKKLRSN
jgi:hypothetical protein